MDRREALKMSVLASIGLAAAGKASAQSGCAGDGTPAQFIQDGGGPAAAGR